MIKKITTLFSKKTNQQSTTDFSVFFHSTSSADKKKLLKAVIREANQDQRDIVKKYDLMKAA